MIYPCVLSRPTTQPTNHAPTFRQQDFTPETVREKRVIQSLSDFFGF